jgi:hypothetical protein
VDPSKVKEVLDWKPSMTMFKNYELEVHYHPGKANVVTDALRSKTHCNYFLVVRMTGEESSTRVLPNLSL